MMALASVASSAWAPSLLGVQRALAPLPRAPAVACDAITLGPTPYLQELRAHTRRALTELEAPGAAELRREGKALFEPQQYGLVLSLLSFLLTLTLARRRHPLRLAAAVFAATRLGCAALSARPDPRVIVPWDEAGRSAKRAVAYYARAAFLAAFGLLTGVGSAAATTELAARLCAPHAGRLLSAGTAGAVAAVDGAAITVASTATTAAPPESSSDAEPSGTHHGPEEEEAHASGPDASAPAAATSRWWRWGQSAAPLEPSNATTEGTAAGTVSAHHHGGDPPAPAQADPVPAAAAAPVAFTLPDTGVVATVATEVAEAVVAAAAAQGPQVAQVPQGPHVPQVAGAMPQVAQAAGSITPVVAVLQQRRARRDVLAARRDLGAISRLGARLTALQARRGL